jgi:hypothetical protein
MTRTRWVTLIGILLIVLFAVVVGGFLWPRPQFQRGPWAGSGPLQADSAGAPVESATPAP